MEPSLFPMSESDERALFRRVADGIATENEFRSLEAQLRIDSELQVRYILHMGLEAQLSEEMMSNSRAPVAATGSRFLQPLSFWNRRRPLLFAVCGIAFGIVVGSFIQSMWQRDAAQPELAVAPVEVTTPSVPESVPVAPSLSPVSAVSNWVEDTNSELKETVAIISFANSAAQKTDPKWFQAGRRLKPGQLTLPEGELQLEFVNGAQVLLNGPAVLKINSAMNASLLAGEAAARVPVLARGFVLNSPGSAVVDLGTEFTVNVSDEGESEVHVTEGEVEISILGQDGNTVKNQRIKENEAVRVRRTESQLVNVSEGMDSVLTIPNRPFPQLVVSDEYVQTIKSAKPFAYWRFEQLEQNQIPNEMGNTFPAVLKHFDSPPSVDVSNGMATFRASKNIRFFTVEEGLPGWNADSFTIELWGCPDRLQHGALIDVLSNDWEGDLNTIEIAMKTALIHPPAAYRFFHRHPPSQQNVSTLNLFDHRTCTPMQWTHLVATKTPDSICLYVNGKQVRRIEAKVGSDDVTYQLVIGQMDGKRIARQFEGALDEVALYDRAISKEEVQQHYNLLNQLNQFQSGGQL